MNGGDGGTLDAKRLEIRDLLRSHPPDVVVVSGLKDAYSSHLMLPNVWQLICISEEYVDLWMNAEKDSIQELSLTALLKTCIDHEAAHWLFTLVSIFSYYRLNFTNSSAIEAGSRT